MIVKSTGIVRKVDELAHRPSHRAAPHTGYFRKGRAGDLCGGLGHRFEKVPSHLRFLRQRAGCERFQGEKHLPQVPARAAGRSVSETQMLSK